MSSSQILFIMIHANWYLVLLHYMKIQEWNLHKLDVSQGINGTSRHKPFIFFVLVEMEESLLKLDALHDSSNKFKFQRNN